MKKRPILCTFCTQSAVRGLTRLFELPSPFHIKRQTLAVFVPQPSVSVFLSGQKKQLLQYLSILCVNVCGLLHSRSYGKNRVHAPFMV